VRSSETSYKNERRQNFKFHQAEVEFASSTLQLNFRAAMPVTVKYKKKAKDGCHLGFLAYFGTSEGSNGTSLG
jgi:hypothetical protein